MGENSGMNYYGAKELAASFRTVRKNTVRVAEDIPEEKYSFQAGEGTRTVAQMLAHIALSTHFSTMVHAVEPRLSNFEGFDFETAFTEFERKEKQPRTKAELIELLKSEGEKYASWLENVPEDVFAERVQMPDQTSKSRFEMILGTKEHEMHHRAQLMVLERMLGITPHLTRDMEERMKEMMAAKAKAKTTA